MDTIIALLTTLNSLSPLAVIALLGLIIFMMVKGKRDVEGHVEHVRNNDLHELPQMAEDIKTMVTILQRIEVKQSEEFSYIRARLNGRS